MKTDKAKSITKQVVRLFKQINVQLIALNFTDGGFISDLQNFKVLSKKTDDLYVFLDSHPDNDIINQFKAIETIQILKATIEGYFKPYSQSVIDLLENVDKIKSIEATESKEIIPNNELPGKDHVVEKPTETKGSLQTPTLTDNNIEILKSYFKADFKGIGRDNENKFDDLLIKDLQKPRNGKDYVAIALIIYENDKLIGGKKPKTFEGWKNVFLDLTGIKPNTYHKYHVRNEVEKLKYEFNYLLKEPIR
jgi:hypothetical protein